MTQKPLFSIISVCYNCQNKVRQTIESLREQTYNNFEYIVIDGDSLDQTIYEVEKLTNGFNRVMIVSEKDKGIYDAMNKGVIRALGEYIFFLNMGDVFHDANVLMDVAKEISDNEDIYYGDICKTDGSQIIQKNKATLNWTIFREYMICHQSIFARRQLLLNEPFDLEYKICSDRDWLIRVIKKGTSVKYIPRTICCFEVEGISSNYKKFEKESLQISVKYGGFLAKMIVQIKRVIGGVHNK